MSSDPIEVLRELRNRMHANGHGGQYDAALDAALASLSAPKPSGDWVLVPREPTEAMLRAAKKFQCDHDEFDGWWEHMGRDVIGQHKAMLAAAPKPESAEAVPAGYVQIAKSALRAMIGDERMAQIEGMCVFPTAPPRPEASDDAGMLPDALVPVSTEWYQLCERAAYSDSIKISGELAEAIVAAICARPTAPQQASAPVGVEVRVGNLPTMNQDEYPGLGEWWVQLWAGDEVFARAYGVTPEEAHSRAVSIRGGLAQQPAAETNAAAWVIVKDGYAELDYPGSGLPDGEHPVYANSAQQPAAVDEEMVERAAIAVFAADSGSVEAWPRATEREREFCRRIARAALAGQQQGGRDDGN